MLRIKLIKSPIGNTKRNRLTVAALGLRKVNQVVEKPDNPAVRGMIHKVKHLLQVEEGAAASTPKPAKTESKPKAEAKPKAKKEKAEDIAPEEPVEAGTPEQPPTEQPVAAGEEV
jgi:large subunit ribosomal protein L30